MSKKTYTAEKIDVHYSLKRCIHAAECVRGVPTVFDPGRRPWIKAENAPATEIADVILRCPTGALSFTRKDEGIEEKPEATNRLSIQKDGPLYLRGNIRLETPEGEILSQETRVAFCRCGLSQNKPFCDNSHKEAFTDSGELGVCNPTHPSGDMQMLRVIPSKDGPLLLRGPVTISGVDGGEVETEKCALCRCGQSSNKPFCDGTHKEVAFVSR